ncbi:MAG: glycosyltransferase family 9 protein [Candidatus Omnitrophota bacterium]
MSTTPSALMGRILLVRNDRFGEFLLNIPAFRAIKESYPGAQVTVAVAPGVEELARAVPFIDRVLVFPPENSAWFELVRFVLFLRREKYDAAVVLNPTARAHQILFWAGIPRRAGYARKHAFFLTDRIADRKGLGHRHEVENNLDLVALLGCATADKSLVLNVPVDIQDHVARKWGLDPSERYVAVHPWTSDSVKQWPLENFEQLVTTLAQDKAHRVVLIGRPEAWHRPLRVPRSDRVIDLSGRTSLLEAAAVLRCCSVLVSCDSGPVHLAASVGTKVVALFRDDMPGKNPERWGPWPVFNHAVVAAGRLEQITLEQVMARI